MNSIKTFWGLNVISCEWYLSLTGFFNELNIIICHLIINKLLKYVNESVKIIL